MRFLRQALIGLVLMSMALGLLGYAGYLGYETYIEVQSREARVPQARERVFTVNVRAAEPQTIKPYLVRFKAVALWIFAWRQVARLFRFRQTLQKVGSWSRAKL